MIGWISNRVKFTPLGLNYCISYISKMSVYDFLRARIERFRLEEFKDFRDKVEKQLTGLRVNVTHRQSSQKFKVIGLSHCNTRNLSFYREGQKKVTDYFLEQYNKDIKYQDIPRLQFEGGAYVPIEFCIMDHHTLNTQLKASERKRAIESRVREGPYGRGIIENFGIHINTTMTTVSGCIIKPPKLRVRGDRNSEIVGKDVIESQPWGILDFTGSLRLTVFISNLQAKFESLGIGMKKPAWTKVCCRAELVNPNSNKALLEEVLGWSKVRIILCVVPHRNAGYKRLKWVSETQIGVLTVCCLKSTMCKSKDEELTSLALKINAKIGGINFEFQGRFRGFIRLDDDVMIIGATQSFHAAAMVGTVNWPAANRYAACVSHISKPVGVRISKFGQLCSELMDSYSKLNCGVTPKEPIIFRGGVTKSDFEMILNEEMKDFKDFFLQEKKDIPTITLLVTLKKHETQFFSDTGHSISIGTVVDTEVIHPSYFDFYLYSDEGSSRSGKPTLYIVLWDEHGFSSEEMQKLTNYLCFRCNEPASLVTLLLYAHLAARRGQLYRDVKTEFERWNPGFPLDDYRWLKPHKNLKTSMFFL